MPRPPVPLPASLRDQPFTTTQARDLAVPLWRLRASDLYRPFHGVRTGLAPTEFEQLAHAYAARMPPHEMFSHTTAAIIHGMRMPRGCAARELHVSAAPPHAQPRARGIIGHHSQLEPMNVGRLRAARPIDAWIQCAGLLHLDDLIVMGDGLLKRFRPLASRTDLELAVRELGGKRNVGALRSALEQVRSRTDSPMETVLRLLIVRAGFPEPEVNGPIRNQYGAVIAHGDLVFRAQKVVLEYDGGGHREERQYYRDIYRLDDIMEERWRVIRVDKFMLARPVALFDKLRHALEQD